MNKAALHSALDAIENSDPVAHMARRLFVEGVTEIELQKALGNRSASPIGNELTNKYRDCARSVPCYNHYGKCGKP